RTISFRRRINIITMIINLLKRHSVIAKNIANCINRNDIIRQFASTSVNHASPTVEKLSMRILLLGSPVCAYRKAKGEKSLSIMYEKFSYLHLFFAGSWKGNSVFSNTKKF